MPDEPFQYTIENMDREKIADLYRRGITPYETPEQLIEWVHRDVDRVLKELAIKKPGV